MNRVYYNQADRRWASHPYPSSAHPKATIKSGGCGPTSGAMIVSSFKNIILPNEMGDLFRANGFRAPQGTSSSAFPWIARKYGLKYKSTIYIAEAVECLRRGGMVVALCQAGSLFSTGGHFIVLADIRGNDLVVYDPYLYAGKFNSGNRRCVKVVGNECIVSVSNFKKYCNYTLFCYENQGGGGPGEYKQGDIIEMDSPFYFTGATQKIGETELFLYDDKTEQPWIHSDTRSLIKNDRLHARATFVWDEGDKCLIQVFNDQFKIKKSEIVKKL